MLVVDASHFLARVCYIQYRFPCEYMRRNVVKADDAQSAE